MVLPHFFGPNRESESQNVTLAKIKPSLGRFISIRTVVRPHLLLASKNIL
jgi:hypothetical protein